MARRAWTTIADDRKARARGRGLSRATWRESDQKVFAARASRHARDVKRHGGRMSDGDMRGAGKTIQR